MPFTRPPLEYPINRLILKVGMALNIWIVHLPPIPTEHWKQRKVVERTLADHLGLDRAVEDGLLKKYRFKWKRKGQVKTIWLIPGEKVRRTPGLARLRDLFLRR